MAPAQQALAEGNMPVFETYETEHELLRRPVFRWDSEVEPKAVGPGRKAVLTIICSGKVGWCVIVPSSRGMFLLTWLKAQAERFKYHTRTSDKMNSHLQTCSTHDKSCIPYLSRYTILLNVMAWTSCLSLQ